MTLHLGVDFDNTIIRYDAVFHRVAREHGLIPDGTPATKEAVREHLRAAGREEDWTALQGEVYGRRLREAEPFPGALDFLADCTRRGVPCSIISHKTRHPYRGPAWDLHAAAQDWLDYMGFFDPARVGMAPERVHFLETKEAKLARIQEVGCTHFLDDLPEILLAPGFPSGVRRLLYGASDSPQAGLQPLPDWAAVAAYFLEEGA